MLPRLSRPELPPSNPPRRSSSDDDALNDSVATVQRPAPFAPLSQKALDSTGATIPRPTPAPKRPSAPPRVTQDANPFAAFENDHVLDDEGSVPTEALTRPDMKLAEAGIAARMPIEGLATPSGLKKPTGQPIVRRTPPPAAAVTKEVEIPAPPPRKTPLPSIAPPESGHTRVAPLQASASIPTPPPMPAYVPSAPSVVRARDIPPLASAGVPLSQKLIAKHSSKIALIAAGVFLAAALVLIFIRRSEPAAPVASTSAFPPVPTVPVPVEVQVAPLPNVVPTTAAPNAVAAVPQAQPQAVANVKTRRHASRPNIPVHREQ